MLQKRLENASFLMASIIITSGYLSCILDLAGSIV
jgi:hypothetical protein